jgi:hypothetical protein
MTEDFMQIISQYGILGLLGYFAIKEFFNWLGKKNGKSDNKQDEKQDIGLAVVNEKLKNIELQVSNHIMHRLEKNDADHLEIKVMLARIEEKIK